MARTKLLIAPFSSATEDLDLKAGQAQVAIADIRLRRDGDVRQLSAVHVVTLAESIVALGLLEPIVVDSSGHLLAGGHRLAALQLLTEADGDTRRRLFLDRIVGAKTTEDKDENTEGEPPKEPKGALAALADIISGINTAAFTEKYPKAAVPVTVVDVSGKEGLARALAVEAAENGVRKQYGPAEVKEIALKLEKAGYRSREGRPKKGEKAAMPVLEAVTGLSPRQLTRFLKSAEDAPEGKSPMELAEAAFRRAANKILVAAKGKKGTKALKLAELAEKVLADIGSE